MSGCSAYVSVSSDYILVRYLLSFQIMRPSDVLLVIIASDLLGGVISY